MRRVPLFLAPALATAAGLVSALRPGSAAAQWSYQIVFTILVALAWTRWRAMRGPARSGYALIAAALSVWLAGDVLYEILSRLTELGDVSVCDALWIAGYPLLATGLVRLAQVRAPGRLSEGVLDALAMATAVAWLCWQFVILPAVENERLSLAVLATAFYPLGDVLLFAAVVALVLVPGSKRGPTPYLVLALAVTLVGDFTLSVLPELSPGLYDDAHAERLDGLLLLGNSLLVAAIMHPDAGRGADHAVRDERLHPARVTFLGIALVVLPITAGLGGFHSLLSRLSLICSVVLLSGLVLARFVALVREQERIRAVLMHQAEHDQLTGLANRPALLTRLEHALARPRDDDFGPVLLYLDLNGFKQVNDRYGHAAGDFVLVECARRLVAALRPVDVVARLGGDEFVVLVDDVPDERQARALADRLRRLVAEPVRRGDDEYRIGVSIGVAAAGRLLQPDADALLAAADLEMYAEKTPRQLVVNPPSRPV
ncbi:GGDEF domain-containing protein [Actinoplanes sp. M2I2]|uniref:diguanylate cyclase domain-containing protein n=1 Tax=Actinoplanes sp. M2I2 TaxID=1734444 RepID=UPI0020223C84|nr:GGDEF domain-containing protein [Actinoplanes sp. M2I2]